jgi:hypothetical protein
MKCAGSNEQDVIGFDRTEFGLHRGSLDQRQQIALYSLSADICALCILAATDFIDFIQKDDAATFDMLDCRQFDVII